MAKILIFEDDPLMARVYKATFSYKGHDVRIAKDGLEGLEMAKSDKPDLILLDVMMPKMNGFEVLDNLKSDQTTVGIPVVMLTNLAVEKDIEDALAKGALKYLIKSDHDPDEIADMVEEILKNDK